MAASYDVPKRIGTKDYIALCFKEMLKTRPFDSISVLELAEVCQLSRTSFYRHFSDKYAVLAWIFKMQLDEIDIEAGGFSSRNLKILKLMAENKKYFRNIFQNDKENWLADHIYQRGCTYFENLLKAGMGVDELPDEIMASIHFFNAGANHLWKLWLATGAKEPPELINEWAIQNMPKVLRQFTDCRE